MRNIEILLDKQMKLLEKKENIISIQYSTGENSLYVLTSNFQIVHYEIDLQNGQISKIWMKKISRSGELIDKIGIVFELLICQFDESAFVVGEFGVLRINLETEDEIVKPELAYNLEISNKDIKESEKEKILCCAKSHDEELFALTTSKNRLILLNRLFKHKKETKAVKLSKKVTGSLNQNDIEIQLLSADISFRQDSQYLLVNTLTQYGRLVKMFDSSLTICESPSTYDPSYPLVRNVFERPRQKLSCHSIWSTRHALVFGASERILTNKNSESKLSNEFKSLEGSRVLEKIVCWEKNGLFHSQFFLPDSVTPYADRSSAKRKKVILVAYNDDPDPQKSSADSAPPKFDDEGDFEIEISKTQGKALFELTSLVFTENEQVLALILKNLRSGLSEIAVMVRSNFEWELKLRKKLTFVANWGVDLGFGMLQFMGRDGTTAILEIYINQRNSNSQSLVCVSRDNELHFTPLAHFNIPPPLSLIETSHQSSITRLAVGHNCALVQDLLGDLYLSQFMFPETVRTLKLSLNILEIENSKSDKKVIRGLALANISEENLTLIDSNQEEKILESQEYLIVILRGDEGDSQTDQEIWISRILVSPQEKENENSEVDLIWTCKTEFEEFRRVREMRLLRKNPPVSKKKQEMNRITKKSKNNDSNESSEEEVNYSLMILTWENETTSLEIPDCESPESEEFEDQIFLPCVPSHIEWIYNNESENFVPIYIGLKDEKLYSGETPIATDVTSFLIFENRYILFVMSAETPYDHLYTFHLSDFINNKLPIEMDPKAISSNQDWRFRNVEKSSALLVCAQDRIIFQLPRGNLETINSRILLLETAAILNDSGKISEAFLLLRKHKLSLSLLSDLDPEIFFNRIESCELFKQLKPKELDLLILDLAEECSPELKYIFEESQIAQREEIFRKKFGLEKKVEGICLMILENLQKNYGYKRIKNEMVVFSKLVPPRYEEGLNRVKSLKSEIDNFNQSKKNESLNNKSNSGPTVSLPQVTPPHLKKSIYDLTGNEILDLQKNELRNSNLSLPDYKAALKYFCWLVDARKLYNSALASFDLDLAILVAQFTHMDPKEYLPYIQSIRDMGDCVDSRTKICVDLKLFKQALDQIKQFFIDSKNNNQDNENCEKNQKSERVEKWEKAVVELIKEENLFSYGLQLFWDFPELSKQIKRGLANRLGMDQNVKSAAEIWAQIGDYGEAFEAYSIVKDWKKALSCLQKGMENGLKVQYPVNMKKFKKKKKKNKKQRRKEERMKRMKDRKKKRKAKVNNQDNESQEILSIDEQIPKNPIQIQEPKLIDLPLIEDFLQKSLKEMESLKAYNECFEIGQILKLNPLKTAEYLLKAQNFKKFKYILSSLPLTLDKKSENYHLTEQLLRELELQSSVITNLLSEKVSNLTEWKLRLKKVKQEKRKILEQALAENDPEALALLNAQPSASDFSESVISQTWMSSQSATSAYSILTGIGPGGRFKRGRQPKNLTDRKCKPGSVYEEDWLTQSLNKLSVSEELEKTVEHLLDLLIRFGKFKEGKELLIIFRNAKVSVHNKPVYKTVLQDEFERANPEVFDIYSHIKEFNADEISKGSRVIAHKDVLAKFNFLIM